MKVLAVSSPHGFTTRDVWKRCIAGMEANGIEVKPFDLLTRWQAFETMLALARRNKIALPPAFAASYLAYEPIFGAAHYHDVDAVLVVSPQYMPMPIIDMLRKSGKKTIGYFTECPYEDTLNAPVQAAHFDYVFVNDRNSVELFRSFADNVFYLPHSYDPLLHYDDVVDGHGDNVVFIGTGYKSRVDLFRSIDWDGIDLELYGIWWMTKRNRLHRYLKGELVENEDTARMYRAAGVGISIHRQMRYVNYDWAIEDGEAYSVGPRTYELAACGTFQVSDHRNELVDIFGDIVPIYTSPEQLGSIVRRAVEDPVWRQDLARKQREAVQGHTCEARMKYLLEQVA